VCTPDLGSTGGNNNIAAGTDTDFVGACTPARRVFTRDYQTLRDTGTLTGVRIAAERDVNEGVDEEEGIV